MENKQEKINKIVEDIIEEGTMNTTKEHLEILNAERIIMQEYHKALGL